MPTPTTYPRTGTHADRIRTYILNNPGVTKNGIILGLKLNPGVVRKAIAGLLEAKVIQDNMDKQGHHHFTTKAPTL